MNSTVPFPAAAFLAIATAATLAWAKPEVATRDAEISPPAARFSPAQLEEVSARWTVAREIVAAMEPQAVQLGLEPAWRQSTLNILLGNRSARLSEIAKLGSYNAIIKAATDRTAAVNEKALGDTSSDLVYKPFTPCRYIDTRNVGGKINGTVSYDLANNGGAYGGVPSCDPKTLVGVASEDTIAALALNVTIVDTSSGAPGFLGVRPAGSANLTSLLNWYVAGQSTQDANATIVTLNQAGPNEMEIVTSGPVHAIVDLSGAFLAPGSTILDCQRVEGAIFDIPANSEVSANTAGAAPSCPAGYLAVSAGIRHATSDAAGTTNVGGYNIRRVHVSNATSNNPWDGIGANCSYFNNNAFDIFGQCEVLCCRIPGR